MINITIIIFTFVFLVTQNILLLNEESLILLCFITFVTLSLNNLSESVSNYFQLQSKQIEESLKNSLSKTLLSLKKFLIINTSLKTILKKFLILKTYYFNLINTIINLIPSYNQTFLISSYKNRLTFLNKIENQTSKLLIIILLKQLNKIVKLKRFYSTSIKSSKFLCLNTILLRERIQSVSLKK